MRLGRIVAKLVVLANLVNLVKLVNLESLVNSKLDYPTQFDYPIKKVSEHLTRYLYRVHAFKRWLSFIERCLTKEVQPCKGPLDGSQLVYLYLSPRYLQGLGYGPV